LSIFLTAFLDSDFVALSLPGRIRYDAYLPEEDILADYLDLAMDIE
jgi:hypothetical protein